MHGDADHNKSAEIIGFAFLLAMTHRPNTPEMNKAFHLVAVEMSLHMTKEELEHIEAVSMLNMRNPPFLDQTPR